MKLFLDNDTHADADQSSSSIFDKETTQHTSHVSEESPRNHDFSILTRLLMLFIPVTLVMGYYTYTQTQAGVVANTTVMTNDDLENGLLLHYTFDGPDMAWASTTAEVLDSSTSSIEGNAVNMTVNSVANGKIGQGLKFDGVDDYVTAGNISSSIFSGDFAVSAWVYHDSNATKYIWGKQTSATVNAELFVRTTNNRFEFRMDDNNGADIVTPDGTAIANRWQHVVVSRVGASLSIYIDGVSATSTTNSESGDSTGAFVIGDNQVGSSLPWNGRIDDTRVYNRSLSVTEIQRLYDLGATSHINTTVPDATLQDGLVAYWTFDGPNMNWTSTTAEVRDASGNGNHGNAGNYDYTSHVIGKLGQGVRLDGTNDNNVIPDSSILEGMANLTVSAWIYQTGNGGGNLGRIVEKGSDYAILYAGSGSNNWIGRVNGTDAATADLAPAILFNNWHHVVMVYDGATITMYVDGIVSGTPVAQTGNVATSSSAVGVGSNTSTTRTFQGILDDARIYNRALSAREVQDHYTSGIVTHINTTIDTNDDLENGLVGHWTFDGPDMNWASTTAEVLDSSASSIEGNAVNMTVNSVAIGKIGQGLNFATTTGSHISASSTLISDLTSKTVSLWVKLRPRGGISSVSIVTKGTSTIAIAAPSDQSIYFVQPFSSQVGFWWTTDNFPRLNEWNHVVISYNRSSASNDPVIYVNGNVATLFELVAPSGTATSDTGFPLTIGASQSPDGVIDDVRIYNRILSPAEVGRLYELGATR